MSDGTDIVRRPANVLATADIMSEAQFDNVFRMAKALAASGTFKDVTQAEQAFARILLGADLGLTPTQALMNIDIVEGNARIRSTMLASWVRKSETYDYKVVEHDADHCVIDFYYNGEVEGTSAFSIADAKAASLIKDHPKSAWKAHPRNMLFARAMSNGVRWFAPDLTGGVPVYTEADVFESTAVELTSGEGDGSEPGWQGVEPAHVERLEAMLERARLLNFPGMSDRATAQMRLAHQSPEAVEEYIRAGEEQLAAVQPPVGELEGEQQTLEES